MQHKYVEPDSLIVTEVLLQWWTELYVQLTVHNNKPSNGNLIRNCIKSDFE